MATNVLKCIQYMVIKHI